MANEPSKFTITLRSAQLTRPCCRRKTTSAEKVEKVVNPPQKPGGDQELPHRVNIRQTVKPRQPGTNHKGAYQVGRQCPNRDSMMHRVELHAEPPAQYAAGATANKNGAKKLKHGCFLLFDIREPQV